MRCNGPQRERKRDRQRDKKEKREREYTSSGFSFRITLWSGVPLEDVGGVSPLGRGTSSAREDRAGGPDSRRIDLQSYWGRIHITIKGEDDRFHVIVPSQS